MKLIAFLLSVWAFVLPAGGQKAMLLSSPNNQIHFRLSVEKGEVFYQVDFNGSKLIQHSQLGLRFLDSNQELSNLVADKPIYRNAVESYELVVGKVRSVMHPFREVLVPLREKAAPNRKINLVVRAFNDGLAFRYEFPRQGDWNELVLAEELSQFRMNGDPTVLALMLPGYTTSHEGEYSLLPLSSVKADTLLDMPALFQFKTGHYVAITEAALLNYAGMYLQKKDETLVSSLSPYPGQPGMVVRAKLPHRSPWRVLLIGDRIETLMESNIITSLNEPNRIKDVSWIKPGKTTFPWWNGSIIPDTSFAPGNNFENNKYYIDFCARNGIEFHSVVESNGHEWYTNDGEGYQPGPGADVTRPVPGIDMKEICDYARSVGVGIRVWVHWKALYPKLDTAFRLFEQWGIQGMMVDFMDRDDQEMTNIKEEILIKAAKHRLHIQFHGAEKPTGLSRTYPNEWTREGTLNYEVNKWEKRVTPDHDLNIVFTRMLAGPTDYHLGGFRAIPDSAFKVQYTRPLMLGTRSHMLAMYVVLESYLGMVCDYPAAYEGQDGFDFIQRVPCNWDETKVVAAQPGHHVAIARRSGSEWYLGSIAGSQGASINVSLDFLGAGNWEAEIYSDPADANLYPNKVSIDRRNVSSADQLQLQLAKGGGAAIRFFRSN